ncbi:hypothetical protein DS742_17815 [Lacrimispora amygdalina]|uniref:Uncharacterized protein n=1 Tax=Lacrimispora amygdalina TaxID=253257 RepID=A0A3E2N9K8_9FIRM|nr:hypothetical protein [Clostridium indicum]RFZ77571.1 hypothetical protein DS742_17815 [Clostridium indicum]
MRKLPAFVLAAAAVLTVAGTPMTAQAATCSRSLPNCFSSDSYSSFCKGQSLNSLLSKYGCNSNSSNCNTSTGKKGASCTGKSCNTGSSCNTRQLSSFLRSCR